MNAAIVVVCAWIVEGVTVALSGLEYAAVPKKSSSSWAWRVACGCVNIFSLVNPCDGCSCVYGKIGGDIIVVFHNDSCDVRG